MMAHHARVTGSSKWFQDRGLFLRSVLAPGVVFNPLTNSHTHGSVTVSKLTPRPPRASSASTSVAATGTSISLGSSATTSPPVRRSSIDKTPKPCYKSSTLFYAQVVGQAQQRQHTQRRESIDQQVNYYTQEIIGNAMQSRLERKFSLLAVKFIQTEVADRQFLAAASYLDDSLSNQVLATTMSLVCFSVVVMMAAIVIASEIQNRL